MGSKSEQSTLIESLIKSGTPHRVTYTNRSTKIEVGESVMLFSPSDFSNKELSFISKTKKHILSLGIANKKTAFKFFDIVWQKKAVPERLTEIDISGAYWECAKKLGYISHEIYAQGLEVDKQVRLAAFGSAATIRSVAIFDGKKYSEFDTFFDENGRAAFFNVALEVSNLLRSCGKVPGSMVLYWVDAVVMLPEFCSIAESVFSENGYGYKKINLTDCRFAVSKDGKKTLSCTEQGGRKKAFNRLASHRNDVLEKIKNFL